ncbi:MAG: hypothetical protein LBH97_01720 [Treponema sp.]|jgi:hypothetical protein|nr:hypothetical protein [Treponema sp.]
MADQIFDEDIDPEIAALLGTGVDTLTAGENPNADDFDDDSADSGDNGETAGVDLSVGKLPEIKKRFEKTPHQFLADPNYYKTALVGEGDISQRIHGLLQKYLNAKDPKDRSVFRQQITTAYWDFLSNVAKKTPGNLPPPKKFLLRFGLLHPTLISTETRDFLSKLVVENELNQPIYYLDEWLKGVGTGLINPSTTDEVRVAKGNNQAHMKQLFDKASGKLDGSKALLKAKSDERLNFEATLKDQFNIIMEKNPMHDIPNVNLPYNEGQKRLFNTIQDTLKNMLRSDHELTGYLKEYRQAESDVAVLHSKVEAEGGATSIDVEAVDTEFETVRQVAKMTVGRKGNHFPLLTSEYFHCGPNDVGFRENVIAILSHIESIDMEVFYRAHKNRLNRIVPFVVLLPTYGDMGACWEPFDKHNRATSRGRIFVPMYPKNIYIALLSAVADLRWQVAKEKASYYWMEEGLTGNYYQWFAAQKLKGNIKDYFVRDYILWMTKESEGIQKLEKEVRGAFWRFMPFSQEVKEKLKNRSYVYQELCQRDSNRAMSSGY